MSYTIIQPPFTLNFSEMPKKDLKDYFRWFFDVLPQRLNELTEVVRQSPGFESWQPDRSPASLDTLGEWFVTQVEMRKQTSAELEEIKSRLCPSSRPHL